MTERKNVKSSKKKSLSKKVKPLAHVSVIGGGTGSFVILSGLKEYPVEIDAIITMMDSGGSTGRLRDQLGVLPPGDLRQALVALSGSSAIWRQLFVYRFDSGDLDGHNFGNIFISALEKMTGSIEESISMAATILRSRGDVIPVTLDAVHLCVEYADGGKIRGETYIDEDLRERSTIVDCYLEPNAAPNPRALDSISSADFIILGPGDLYTSIIPNLVVDGVPNAITNSKAKIIYVMNLMTKRGQTSNMNAKKHVEVITKYLGRTPDFVVINNKNPNKDIIDWYNKTEGAAFVIDDFDKKESFKVIRADILSKTKYEKSKADRIKRSLIRHDSQKLAATVMKIIKA